MTIEVDALSIFDTNDIFSLVYEARNKSLEDGTILKSIVADVKVKLNVFNQKGSIISVGSIGLSTILLAHTAGKWLMYMNEDTNTLPPSADRRQQLSYFTTVMRSPDTKGYSCESDDWDSFAANVCRFIKECRCATSPGV